MKILLAILAVLTFLMGIAASILPCAIVWSFFYSDFEPLVLIIAIPVLLFAFLAFKYSVSYLIKRNERTANPIATFTGVVAWIFFSSLLDEYSEQLEDVSIYAGGSEVVELDFLWLVLPIMCGMVVTRILKHGIKRTFPKQDAEPVAQGVIAPEVP